MDKDDMTNELVDNDDIEQLVRDVKEEDREEQEGELDADDIPDFEEEKEEDDDSKDEQLELLIIKGEKYFIAEESKRVYRYIDDDTEGEQIGKLENGNLVPL